MSFFNFVKKYLAIYESNLVSEDLPDPGKDLDSQSMNMDYIIEPPTAFSDTSTQCSLLTPITDSMLQYIESLYYVFGFTETSSLNEVHKEPALSFMKFAGLPDEVADLVIELMKMRQNVLQPNLESPPVMTSTRVERYTQTNSVSELNDLTENVLYTETGTQCELLSPSTDSILQNIDLLYSAFGFK
ncbi:uncharacterized protein LOC126901039 [Daktulosphaira vitifoliae]|uniref:uncharacterized protein LOC126901039 n=1 Tax=Daktulosphaira vitifoliae TaxID=58002 RepID=UPI0021AA0D5E|nr:uncharacterized protein LOC126901039 [Daktulosphaira vitifoliae]